MQEKSNACGITDIVEMVKQSKEHTILRIADEILRDRWQRNIDKICLNYHCTELPVISYSSCKRRYTIKLSSENEGRQLSQISVLILVVLEEIDLNVYDELNSLEELLECSAIWREHFNNIKAAFVAKNIHIL